MLNNLFQAKPREQDKASKFAHDSSDRSERLYADHQRWFFKTREGLDVGPFDSKSDAQYALRFFTERKQWPDTQQLQEFIEGCELFDQDKS